MPDDGTFSAHSWASRLAPRRITTTHAEIEAYRPRYGPFLDDIALELAEFAATGTIRRARELAATAGQHVNHNWYPQYFTGDLDADIVLVHLNPKQPNDPAERYAGPFTVTTFEQYFDAFRHFGEGSTVVEVSASTSPHSTASRFGSFGHLVSSTSSMRTR
jgi:hypothetical protein